MREGVHGLLESKALAVTLALSLGLGAVVASGLALITFDAALPTCYEETTCERIPQALKIRE